MRARLASSGGPPPDPSRVPDPATTNGGSQSGSGQPGGAFMAVIASAAFLVAAPLPLYRVATAAWDAPVLLAAVGVLLAAAARLLLQPGPLAPSARTAVVIALVALAVLHWEEATLKANLIGRHQPWSTDEALIAARHSLSRGRLVFDDPHAYFPFAGLVISTVVRLTGLSVPAAAAVSGVAVLGMVVALVVVVVEQLHSTPRFGDGRASAIAFLAFAVTFAPIFAGRGQLGYRFSGPVLVAAMIAAHWLAEQTTWQQIIVDLLLVTAAATDSSVAAAMAAIYFGLDALRRKELPTFRVVVPVAWIVLVAGPYLKSVGHYGHEVAGGLRTFVVALGHGRLPSVLPGRHAALPSPLILLAAAFGALAMLGIATWAVARAITAHTSWTLPSKVPLAALLPGLAVVPVTWVGSYIAPQSSSSDVRDIVLLLLSTVFAFGIATSVLIRPLRRGATAGVGVLVGVVFLAQVAQWYPVAARDPVRAVEDPRVSRGQAEDLAQQLAASPSPRRFVSDYATCIRMLPVLRISGWSCTSDPPFSTPDASLLAINRRGVELSSTNAAPGLYRWARPLETRYARVYDAGDVSLYARQR